MEILEDKSQRNGLYIELFGFFFFVSIDIFNCRTFVLVGSDADQFFVVEQQVIYL